MRKYLLLFIALSAINIGMAQTLDAEQIYKKVNNAVVQVYAYDSDSKILSQGSGVVLNDKGWIVTNYHVYNGSDKLIVKHNEKIIAFSEIIGVDADKDILILKIADHTFPSITIGNSDSLHVGQKIYAIGSPEGFENTITEGIISGLRSYEAHTQNYIQISAPISHGSSGGAIVNAKGKLIGISALSSKEGQNLNFAIPVNEVLKVYKKEGVDKTTLSAENYFYQGMKEYNAGNYDKAIESYKNSIASNPKQAETYNSLGLVYKEQGDYNKAITYYKKAIAIDPNLSEAYSNLGVAYENNGDHDVAISCFKQAIASDANNATTYYNLGLAYKKKGDYDVAIYNYKQAIAINPNYAKAYNNLAGAYTVKGDYNTAIYNYKKAIAIEPNFASAYYNLGILYELKEDSYNSNLNKEKAYQLNPSLNGQLPQLHNQTQTISDIISDGDSKLAAEQRKYRLWLEGLTPYLASCFSAKEVDKVSSIEANIALLYIHQNRVTESLKTILLFIEEYGSQLESAIPTKTGKEEFIKLWRTFSANLTVVYTADSDIMGEMISSLNFLKSNRSKYFLSDGQIDTKDEKFREQLIGALAKVDSEESRNFQQQQRNQAILNCAKAIEIAKRY